MGALSGMALSLPLWQTRTTYPHAPLFDFIPAFPQPFDALLFVAFAAAFGILVWLPRLRLLGTLWLLAAVFLALQDQSRLQPWFVEYVLLLTAVIFSKSEAMAFNGCRMVIAAIYFWSGLHKMNDTFFEKLFPWMVSSISTPTLAATLHFIGVIAPYMEVGFGLALLFPQTRRPGVLLSVCMHLLLLAMLGPWSLGWNNIVWPWNLAMIVLVPCLFWGSAAPASEILKPRETWARHALFFFVIVLPPLSLIGLWDTYPSFALYSGNPLIGSVVFTPDAWKRLDSQTRAVAEPLGDRYLLRLDDWSLVSMNVPAYPAERVLRRVARSFCAVHEIDGDALFILEQPSRWLYRSGWQKIERPREFCV